MFTEGDSTTLRKERKPRPERQGMVTVSVPAKSSACGSCEPCGFCLEAMQDSSEQHSLSCGHKFHKDCFRKYVEFCAGTRQSNLLRCPLCRGALEDFRLAKVGFEQARLLLTDTLRCRQAGVRMSGVRHTHQVMDESET